MKHSILILFGLFFISQLSIAQFNKILIFKREKKIDSELEDKIIKIDSTGSIFVDNVLVSKINLKSISENFTELIKAEKLKIIPASNDLPRMAATPELGFQLIYVNIFPKTNQNDREQYISKSHYTWREDHKADEDYYWFYKYFNEENLTLIKNIFAQDE